MASKKLVQTAHQRLNTSQWAHIGGTLRKSEKTQDQSNRIEALRHHVRDWTRAVELYNEEKAQIDEALQRGESTVESLKAKAQEWVNETRALQEAADSAPDDEEQQARSRDIQRLQAKSAELWQLLKVVFQHEFNEELADAVLKGQSFAPNEEQLSCLDAIARLHGRSPDAQYTPQAMCQLLCLEQERRQTVIEPLKLQLQTAQARCKELEQNLSQGKAAFEDMKSNTVSKAELTKLQQELQEALRDPVSQYSQTTSTASKVIQTRRVLRQASRLRGQPQPDPTLNQRKIFSHDAVIKIFGSALFPTQSKLDILGEDVPLPTLAPLTAAHFDPRDQARSVDFGHHHSIQALDLQHTLESLLTLCAIGSDLLQDHQQRCEQLCWLTREVDQQSSGSPQAQFDPSKLASLVYHICQILEKSFGDPLSYAWASCHLTRLLCVFDIPYDQVLCYADRDTSDLKLLEAVGVVRLKMACNARYPKYERLTVDDDARFSSEKFRDPNFLGASMPDFVDALCVREVHDAGSLIAVRYKKEGPLTGLLVADDDTRLISWMRAPALVLFTTLPELRRKDDGNGQRWFWNHDSPRSSLSMRFEKEDRLDRCIKTYTMAPRRYIKEADKRIKRYMEVAAKYDQEIDGLPEALQIDQDLSENDDDDNGDEEWI